MTRRTLSIAIFSQALAAALWQVKSLTGFQEQHYVVDMVCELPSTMTDLEFKSKYEHIIFPTSVINNRLKELLAVGEIVSIEETSTVGKKIWRYVFKSKRAYEAWHKENIVSASKHAESVSPEISSLFNFYERHITG